MESKANDVAPIKIPENYLNSQTEEDIGAFADPKEGCRGDRFKGLCCHIASFTLKQDVFLNMLR